MKITAEFNDLEEMKMFIRNFEGENANKAVPVAPTVQPVTPVAQMATPVTSPQPTAPVQTPVASAPSQPVVPTQAAVPTSAVTYTQDELQRAAVTLLDAGRQNDLVTMLNSFGVEAITMLPKERYGEFATALRQMGAQI
mgnify:FL=1